MTAVIQISIEVKTSVLPDYHDKVKIWHTNEHNQQQQILIISHKSRKLVSYSYLSSELRGSTGVRKLHKLKDMRSFCEVCLRDKI